MMMPMKDGKDKEQKQHQLHDWVGVHYMVPMPPLNRAPAAYASLTSGIVHLLKSFFQSCGHALSPRPVGVLGQAYDKGRAAGA
jgi:hypothetical protein